ncbi:MAG: hypothetical protein Q8M20_00900 [Rhodocyclaceae bacterium]|nr:hypothetical protein [Rhodocyclaceae bacterium]MDZ4214948.1 hypothetical protein [Rhodocyclaceae bacterium]
MQNKQTVRRERQRPAKMKWCEVVRVASQGFLVNARQRACRYETEDGQPLASGYYLALWPEGAALTRFCAAVRYLGPFSTRDAACLMQTSALGLGIVELEMEDIPTLIATRPTTSRWGQASVAADCFYSYSTA